MSKRKTQEEILERFISIHGNKYNYTKTVYVDSRENVIIICKTHGGFQQTPSNHLAGKGCNKCVSNQKLTNDEFIKRATLKHGSRYDYSKVVYQGVKNKVIIICKTHGEFSQCPKNHLNGYSCKKCFGAKKSTIEEFIEKSIKIHGDKYDYSKSAYTTCDKKIIITCKEHGDFFQIPKSHLGGRGCKACGGVRELTTETFIEKVKLKHGDKYDYSLVNYERINKNIKIISYEIGIFVQTPQAHLKGVLSRPLYAKSLILNPDNVLGRFKAIHGGKYNYDLMVFEKMSAKIIIKCNDCGNVFKQAPEKHALGSGCPKCGVQGGVMEDKLFKATSNYFPKNKIISQGKPIWLGRQSFDIYFEEFDIAIEYQGSQHFVPVKYFGGGKAFEKILNRDAKKNDLAKINGCKIFYFTYDKKIIPEQYMATIYSSETELFNAIKLYIQEFETSNSFSCTT